jgi:hypothetical protein
MCLGYAQTTIKGTVTSKGDGNPLTMLLLLLIVKNGTNRQKMVIIQ